MAFEKLPEALDELFDRRGIDSGLERKTVRHRLEHFFTPATLQIVNELYQQDFMRFGYPILDRLDL